MKRMSLYFVVAAVSVFLRYLQDLVRRKMKKFIIHIRLYLLEQT